MNQVNLIQALFFNFNDGIGKIRIILDRRNPQSPSKLQKSYYQEWLFMKGGISLLQMIWRVQSPTMSPLENNSSVRYWLSLNYVNCTNEQTNNWQFQTSQFLLSPLLLLLLFLLLLLLFYFLFFVIDTIILYSASDVWYIYLLIGVPTLRLSRTTHQN